MGATKGDKLNRDVKMLIKGKWHRIVHTGEELRSDDVYLSTSGMWQPCPCPGVMNHSDNFWRPLEHGQA